MSVCTYRDIHTLQPYIIHLFIVSYVPYAENTSHSTNKYSCVRPEHTLYISYFIEHNGDVEPRDDESHNLCRRCDPMTAWGQ